MPAAKKTACLTPTVHVTADRLFAHVFLGSVQVCFENNGSKLEPGCFAATAAHGASGEISLADVSDRARAVMARALSQELAHIIEISKPRKLTFAQVQRIYGRAVD